MTLAAEHPRRRITGAEYLQKMMSGELPHPPLVEALGIRLTHVEPGRVVMEVEPSRMHDNGIGIAHGGLVATLLDSALGCAVNSQMPAGRMFTTLEMKVNFTRAVRRDVGTLRCEANVVTAGRRTALSEGRVVDAKGTIYAHAVGTWIVYDDAPRGESAKG